MLCLLALSVGLAGCSQHVAPTGHQAPPFQVTATIQELMDSEIDPAADALWDSVGSVSTLSGTEDRQPRTEEEWKAVRRQAITLVEATNLLVMEGRPVAPKDAPAAADGELAPAEMQRRIESTRPSFVGFAQSLRLAGLNALAAIDAKDPQRLMDAGGTIDEACEACHVTYWYPNQKIPTT